MSLLPTIGQGQIVSTSSPDSSVVDVYDKAHNLTVPINTRQEELDLREDIGVIICQSSNVEGSVIHHIDISNLISYAVYNFTRRFQYYSFQNFSIACIPKNNIIAKGSIAIVQFQDPWTSTYISSFARLAPQKQTELTNNLAKAIRQANCTFIVANANLNYPVSTTEFKFSTHEYANDRNSSFGGVVFVTSESPPPGEEFRVGLVLEGKVIGKHRVQEFSLHPHNRLGTLSPHLHTFFPFYVWVVITEEQPRAPKKDFVYSIFVALSLFESSQVRCTFASEAGNVFSIDFRVYRGQGSGTSTEEIPKYNLNTVHSQLVLIRSNVPHPKIE